MRLHILAGALASAAALSISPAASAATVPIDYTLSVTDKGLTINFGTMILDYDGSSYMLESLVLSVPKRTTVVTSDVTLAPVSGTSDYCIYSFSSCGVVPEKDSIYFIFDPSLNSQTSTVYGYSTTDQTTKSFVMNITRSVPEAATWALMLLGFGAIGIATRMTRIPVSQLA